MILLVVIILVAAVVTGSLGGVLEIAAGVAVGLLLFVVGLAVLGVWFVKRKVRGASEELERRKRQRDRRELERQGPDSYA